MKQQLFGLRKAYVKKLLKQLKFELSSQNTELIIEAEKVKFENHQLENELEELTREIASQKEDVEVWELGQERIEKVVQFLDEKKALEMEELRNDFAERTRRIDHQMEELTTDIHSVETLFSDLFHQFIHRVENPEVTSMTSETEDSFQFEPIDGNSIHLKEETDLSQLYSKNEAAASIEWIEKEEEMQETLVEKEELEEIEEIKRNPVAEDEILQQTDTPDKSESFWGDIELWTNDRYPSMQEEPIAKSKDHIDINGAFTTKVYKEESLSPFLSTKGEIREESARNKEPELSGEHSNNVSDDLLEQIDSIKTQYIVGKVAGEDLFDLQGNRILAKNSVITREAVERAHRIGKLAELIVNMKFTGPGVD